MDADAARAVIEPAFDEDARQRCMSGDFTPALSAEDIAAARAMSRAKPSLRSRTASSRRGMHATRRDLDGPRRRVLRSGQRLGRATIQAHLQWGVKRAVGVELSAERSAQARRAGSASNRTDSWTICQKIGPRVRKPAGGFVSRGDSRVPVLRLLGLELRHPGARGARETRGEPATDRHHRAPRPQAGLRPAWLTLKRATRVGQTGRGGVLRAMCTR